MGPARQSTRRKPSRKALGKGPAPLQEMAPSIPRPPPPSSPHSGKGTDSAHTDRGQRHARRSGKMIPPLLRGLGGFFWFLLLTCLLVEVGSDKHLLSRCQTSSNGCWAASSCQTWTNICRVSSQPESRPPPWETSPETRAFTCAFETRAFPCAVETCVFACAFSVPEKRVPFLVAENDPVSPPPRERRVRRERRARPWRTSSVIPLEVCPDLNQTQGLERDTLQNAQRVEGPPPRDVRTPISFAPTLQDLWEPQSEHAPLLSPPRKQLARRLPMARPPGQDKHRHGGYRGVRVGEANNPGPPDAGPSTPK